MTVAGYHAGTPGFNAIRESSEADVLFGNPEFNQAVYKSVIIDSTAVGSGSPTTILLPGQVLSELDSGAGWVDYDPDATDGSQYAKAVLVEEVNLLDPATAAGADRHARVMIAGPVKGGNLIDLDEQARGQLAAGGFIFDDDRWANRGKDFSHIIPKTSAYTVTAAESGAMFTTSGAGGAVTFTLPTIAVGLSYTFLNLEDQNMTVASGEGDNMVLLNDLAADSVAFSTSNELIGASVKVHAIYDGTTLLWYVQNLSPGAHTLTVAT